VLFQDVFTLSGYPSQVKEYGDFYTHDGNPRALIFARNQSAVVDLEGVKRLMQYNDYQLDPLSFGQSVYGVSSRCALPSLSSPTDRSVPGSSLRRLSAQVMHSMEETYLQHHDAGALFTLSGTMPPLPVHRRCDLPAMNQTFGYSRTAFGGVDSKVSTALMALEPGLTVHAISGPTHQVMPGTERFFGLPLQCSLCFHGASPCLPSLSHCLW
jgi:hypothetical protein